MNRTMLLEAVREDDVSRRGALGGLRKGLGLLGGR
jgi:hypothetical protein